MQAREDMTNNEQPSEVNSSTPQACGLIPRKEVSAFAGEAKAMQATSKRRGVEAAAGKVFIAASPEMQLVDLILSTLQRT